ncbi:hypothetical protein IPP75_00950 [Candidatus Saccharibacteria bacterium]|nr:MAG: hypothetical protein IPP75_00950 [Candidatus Saccharibacteria bacterium]
MQRRNKSTFFCFSPPVMMATFLIEIGLALWTLWRYRMSRLVQLSVATFVCLAVFQLAEYTICEGLFGLSQLTWAKIGYVAITALPALGIHLLSVIAKQKVPWLLALSYGSMFVFMGYFLFAANGISATTCGGNYVIFKTSNYATSWYTLYYYGLELLVVAASIYLARKVSSQRTKQALLGLTAGYLGFMVPVAIANTINPEFINAVPSVMCGFAVIFALSLGLYVLPRTAHPRQSRIGTSDKT